MQLFLKAKDLNDFDTLSVEKISRYVPLAECDILSLDDLLSIINELCYECDKRDEEIEDLKNEIDNLRYPEHNSFDYGEWKMSIDSANGR